MSDALDFRPGQTCLLVEHLAGFHGETQALHDISFEVKTGGIVSLTRNRPCTALRRATRHRLGCTVSGAASVTVSLVRKS